MAVPRAAAGDIVEHSGKLDLIATGFAETAVGRGSAAGLVDIPARRKSGHSTNMKTFKDQGARNQ